MKHNHYDLAVIGGGIVGVSAARDAGGRDLKVALIEKGELGGETSNRNSHIAHGGLRYIRNGEPGLVYEGNRERARLLKNAPHLVEAREWVLLNDPRVYPFLPRRVVFWGMRLVTALYDLLSADFDAWPRARSLNLKDQNIYSVPLSDIFRQGEAYTARGIIYSDGRMKSARLVIENAIDAQKKGADLYPQTEVINLTPGRDIWTIGLEDKISGSKRTLQAKAVINATGPWARDFIETMGLPVTGMPALKLIQGSHMIVKQAYKGRHNYTLPRSADGKRVVFFMPLGKELMLCGTTEKEIDSMAEAGMSDEEREELLTAFNRLFKQRIKSRDILKEISGVRVIPRKGSAKNMRSLSRKALIHIHRDLPAKMVSHLGGKFTAYRQQAALLIDWAEEAIKGQKNDRGFFSAKPSWTVDAPLPGGNLNGTNLKNFIQEKAKSYPWLPPGLLHRYAGLYGARIDLLLRGAKSMQDLGRHFGEDLYEIEARFAVRSEYARSAEGVLLRSETLYPYADQTRRALEQAMKQILREELGS